MVSHNELLEAATGEGRFSDIPGAFADDVGVFQGDPVTGKVPTVPWWKPDEVARHTPFVRLGYDDIRDQAKENIRNDVAGATDEIIQLGVGAPLEGATAGASRSVDEVLKSFFSGLFDDKTGGLLLLIAGIVLLLILTPLGAIAAGAIGGD